MTPMSPCPACQSAVPSDASFCPECGRPVKRLEAASAASLDDDTSLMTIGGLATIGEQATGGGERTSVPALEPGTRFADRYTVTGLLGAGGMGVVYRAHDDLAHKDVALKLIRPESATSGGAMDRLVREGLTARDIRHENVISVYDVGRADGQPYLSMEVVEGTSMRAWLREKSAAEREVRADVAIAIAKAIARGLQAAHAKGVIHRDLKPENVILTAEPRAASAPLKVLDFGIARAAQGRSANASEPAGGLGTPKYMAPEQLTSADQAGASADVYSLSVMLYEMLVGVLPQGHWQPPSGGRSDVPRGLDELVQEGLSNRPGSRPPSMSNFIERLEGLGTTDWGKSGKRAMDEIQSLGEKWRENTRKSLNSRWKIAGAVLVVLLVLGLLMEGEEGGFGTDDGPGPGPSSELSMLDLTGRWTAPGGHSLNVDVFPGGELRGAGMALGESVSVAGAWQNNHIEFALFLNGQPYIQYQGNWDGDSTLEVGVYAVTGEHIDNATFFINRGY